MDFLNLGSKGVFFFNPKSLSRSCWLVPVVQSLLKSLQTWDLLLVTKISKKERRALVAPLSPSFFEMSLVMYGSL